MGIQEGLTRGFILLLGALRSCGALGFCSFFCFSRRFGLKSLSIEIALRKPHLRRRTGPLLQWWLVARRLKIRVCMVLLVCTDPTCCLAGWFRWPYCLEPWMDLSTAALSGHGRKGGLRLPH